MNKKIILISIIVVMLMSVVSVDSRCLSGADINNDNIVSRTELGFFIVKWVRDNISRIKLGEIINDWVNGCAEFSVEITHGIPE